jgi:pilus assembly protein Flp/PilA
MMRAEASIGHYRFNGPERFGTAMGQLIARVRADDGATAVEYAIIASLIAAVVVGIVMALGLRVSDLFSSVPNF